MRDKTEIKIVTDDDESLKILGELLSNKTSRVLIKYLMDNSTYKNKIADELKVPFPLVEHHLKKLEKLGLVKITNKKLVKNGKLHKNYKINADGIFVTFNKKEEIKEKGILKKIFREGIKFAIIITAALFSWIQLRRVPNSIGDTFDYGEILEIPLYQESTFLPCLIIIVGLIINTIFLYKKNKMGH